VLQLCVFRHEEGGGKCESLGGRVEIKQVVMTHEILGEHAGGEWRAILAEGQCHGVPLTRLDPA
jgi:hypothetical protein